MSDPQALVGGEPYRGYAYSYPHKTAYGPLDPPLRLEELWAEEDLSALSLYIHVPFCAQRCSFCNLFTTTQGRQREQDYLRTLRRQGAVLKEVLQGATYSVAAIGGGTPTWLSVESLGAVFDLVHDLGATNIPLSVECSPETIIPEKADLLVRRGATRVSIGVQSFVESEARSVGRTQRNHTVQSALHALRSAGVQTLNLDLIYGIRGQTPASWQQSLEQALEWQPEEIYLYPLYVRPLTGLGRRDRAWDDQRLALYRQGRDFLKLVGYTQHSMRMFRAPHAPSTFSSHRCQADAMVGLGPGARSYTASVHLSTPFAVGPSAVVGELDAWLQTEDFRELSWGGQLSEEERRRRHLIQSLLQAEGLDRSWYRARFGADVLEHFPLQSLGEWVKVGDRIQLTEEGLAWSDAIGPWLYSEEVRQKIARWELR